MSSAASMRNRAAGVFPPESATWKEPRAAPAARASATKRAAPSRATATASSSTTTPGKDADILSLLVGPLAVVAGEHVVRLARSPGSRGIVREVARWQRLPHVQHGLHNAPGRFHH